MQIRRQKLVTEFTGGKTQQAFKSVSEIEPGADNSLGDQFESLLNEEQSPDDTPHEQQLDAEKPADDVRDDDKRLHKERDTSPDSERSRDEDQDERIHATKQHAQNLNDLLHNRQQWQRSSTRRRFSETKKDDDETTEALEQVSKTKERRRAHDAAVSGAGSEGSEQRKRQQDDGNDPRSQANAADLPVFKPMDLQLQSTSRTEPSTNMADKLAEVADAVASHISTNRDTQTGDATVHIQLRESVFADTSIDVSGSAQAGVQVRFHCGSNETRETLRAHSEALGQAISRKTGMTTTVAFAQDDAGPAGA